MGRQTCPHCGGTDGSCSDPEKAWFPQRRVCHASMVTAWVEFRYGQIHEDAPFHDGTFRRWSSVRSETHPYHYADGVDLFVAAENLHPEDDFLTMTPIHDDDEQQDEEGGGR